MPDAEDPFEPSADPSKRPETGSRSHAYAFLPRLLTMLQKQALKTEIWKMEDDSSEQSGGLSYADKNQDAFARFSFNLHFQKLYVVVSSPSDCLSSCLRFLNGVITPLPVYVNQTCYRSRGTERMGSLTTPESEVAAVAGPCPVSVLNPGLDRSAIWRFSRSIRNTSFLAS